MINSVKRLANIERCNTNGAAPVYKILDSRFQRKYRIHRANLLLTSHIRHGKTQFSATTRNWWVNLPCWIGCCRRSGGRCGDLGANHPRSVDSTCGVRPLRLRRLPSAAATSRPGTRP